ncbi:hypothetical protein NDU88_004684 [Pleurodeles waltl]|uniref:Secreted protein n=1 Tax=Pleurodeles waltl TaxID=8319 RepID=A0AAV7LVC7_PLEWA|nr:hypothetical protein NDU88_004684 [Pleurodeles waltl]
MLISLILLLVTHTLRVVFEISIFFSKQNLFNIILILFRGYDTSTARVESRAGIARTSPNSLKDAKAGAGSRAKNVARDKAHPIVDSTGT